MNVVKERAAEGLRAYRGQGPEGALDRRYANGDYGEALLREFGFETMQQLEAWAQKEETHEEGLAFLSQMDFNTRSRNVLADMGIFDMASFNALTREEVMATPNAGWKTWRDINSVQEDLRPLTPAEAFARDWRVFRRSVDAMNRAMSRSQSFRVVLDSRGRAQAARVYPTIKSHE